MTLDQCAATVVDNVSPPNLFLAVTLENSARFQPPFPEIPPNWEDVDCIDTVLLQRRQWHIYAILGMLSMVSETTTSCPSGEES